MRLTQLIAEGARTMLNSRVPAALIAVVVGTMCMVTVLTLGRAVAARVDIAEKLEEAGARELVVTDATNSGFIADYDAGVVKALDSVDLVIALGSPSDSFNGIVRDDTVAIATYSIRGDVSRAIRLLEGRSPKEGEAIVTPEAMKNLGLALPSGLVIDREGRQLAIVGLFQPEPLLKEYDNVVLTTSSREDPVRELRLLVKNAADLESTQASVLLILAPADPATVRVTSGLQVATIAAQIDRQIAGFGRTLVLVVLALGALLCCAVVLADVLVNRKDLGRRRALGASRTVIVGLTTTRTLLCATLGSIPLTLLAIAINFGQGVWTPLPFAVAVMLLTTLSAGVAAVPPAVLAAWQDPVVVLRTP